MKRGRYTTLVMLLLLSSSSSDSPQRGRPRQLERDALTYTSQGSRQTLIPHPCNLQDLENVFFLYTYTYWLILHLWAITQRRRMERCLSTASRSCSSAASHALLNATVHSAPPPFRTQSNSARSASSEGPAVKKKKHAASELET